MHFVFIFAVFQKSVKRLFKTVPGVIWEYHTRWCCWAKNMIQSLIRDETDQTLLAGLSIVVYEILYILRYGKRAAYTVEDRPPVG